MYPPGWSYQFKQHRFLRTHVDDVDRAEAWSIAAMWPQVESRAVFLTSHSFLFGQGQESKLRQELVEPKNQISAVLNLPPGLMGMTNIPGGLLVLDARAEPNVRMLDISGQTIEGRVKQRFGKDLDVAGVMDYYEGHDDVPQLATDAIAPEIASCDYSLMPTRYTRRIHSLGDDLVPLEDLVLQVLRAPPAVKDGVSEGVQVLKMGDVQDGEVILGTAARVGFETEGLPDLLLNSNDLLYNRTNSAELVGKTGIFKGPPATYSFASYLIRLRFDPEFISADYVNFAMNAPYFRATQINPLLKQQCGQANVNGTAMQNMLIPVPPVEEQRRIVAAIHVLFDICDQLKTHIAAARTKHAQLAVALVEAAVA